MKHVILDTDISNEIDDQFALAYLLKSLNKDIELDAITIAPFSNSEYHPTNNVIEGSNLSCSVAKKICVLCNKPKYKEKVYLGAFNYFFESKETNEAVNRIIDICRKNKHTTIIGIAAITNIALAIYHAPDIINKIDIIWLGGKTILDKDNYEYNFYQDVEAISYVYDSGVEFVNVPCNNVASHMLTTTYEINHYLKGRGELGDYLCELFATCRKASFTEDDMIGFAKELWDVSAIAYFINKEWFTTQITTRPKINKDTSYSYINNKYNITFATYFERRLIFKDLFSKL